MTSFGYDNGHSQKTISSLVDENIENRDKSVGKIAKSEMNIRITVNREPPFTTSIRYDVAGAKFIKPIELLSNTVE